MTVVQSIEIQSSTNESRGTPRRSACGRPGAGVCLSRPKRRRTMTRGTGSGDDDTGDTASIRRGREQQTD
ncbi:hypothetical protein [Burkholderia seminalis]|nr:hypothetical protein [Burkholderia seminalis]